MSVEVKLTFANVEEATAFLSSIHATTEASVAPAVTVAEPQTPKAAHAPKPAKTEGPAATPSTATPAPTVEPAPSPTPAAAAGAAGELPYPPLAERITKVVAASNPQAATNRARLKTFFAELTAEYGSEVRNGQGVKAADRPRLTAVLDKIEDEMS